MTGTENHVNVGYVCTVVLASAPQAGHCCHSVMLFALSGSVCNLSEWGCLLLLLLPSVT